MLGLSRELARNAALITLERQKKLKVARQEQSTSAWNAFLLVLLDIFLDFFFPWR